jgi:hypothetical protein
MSLSAANLRLSTSHTSGIYSSNIQLLYGVLLAVSFWMIPALAGCGGGNSNSAGGSSPPAPAPTYISVTPSTGFAGGGTALTILGTNFRAGVTVTMGGIPVVSPSLNGSGSLSATAPPHAVGLADIVIKNSDGTSVTATSAYTFLNNAVPTVSDASPNPIAAGSASTPLTINGTGYTLQSAIQLNGTALTSQFGSDHQLTATLPASLIASAKMGRLTVSNPTPGGGSSDSGPTFAVGPTLPASAYGQTVTTLQDGRILICGGLNVFTPTSSAAIYTPATNAITSVGPMTVARYAHTATLLPSGKVLIAGGTDVDNVLAPLATAEIFDPNSNTFTATGPMVNRRSLHTATLLPTGKVLLAGSYNTLEQQTAEIFDPATNAFTAAPQMTTKRAEHSAVPLTNGNILIMGGVTACAVSAGDGFCTDLHLSSAEIYDSSTNSFSAVGPMHVGRRLASVVVLKSGKVFVVGGADQLGTSPSMATTQAELYDPATRQFSIAASSNIGFWNGVAVLLTDGRVLVCGGHDGTYSFGYAQIFDPISQTFFMIPAMNTPRLGFGGALLPSGSVALFGGSSDASNGLNSTEIFSPTSLTAEYLLKIQNPAPTLSQLGPAVTVAGDTATLSGTGFNSQSELLINGESLAYSLNAAQQIQFPMPALFGTYSIAVSNPAPGGGLSNAIQQTSHVALSVHPSSPQLLPGSATALTVTAVGGGGYTSSIREGALGGTLSTGLDGHWLSPDYIAPSAPGTYHIDYVSSVEPQATATATVTVSNSAIHASSISLQAPHTAGVAATKLSNGKLLITGGGTGSVSTSIAAELLDPAAASSTLVAPLNVARSGHTSTTLANGKVLIVGGVTPNAGGTTSATATTEIFDPATSTFSVGPILSTARNGHFGLLLPSGDVLIAGGCTATSAVSTEIFRASTKTMQAGPTFRAAHCAGQATVLASGLILFTGGYDPSNSTYTPTAETYDPTTNTFSAAGTLIQARYSHAATLLTDGRVIVTGGYSSTTGTSATTEYFDPTNRSFSQGPALAQPRQEHGAIVVSSGGLFIVGGDKQTGPFGVSSNVLEVLASSFNEMTLLTPRVNPIVLSANGSSFVLVGGTVQSADVVTVNTTVPLPPNPSLSSCAALSSQYITCNAYDLQTPITVIIDGRTSSTTPFTSNRFDIGTYPYTLAVGPHTIQVQNPNGKLSNVLPFTF